MSLILLFLNKQEYFNFFKVGWKGLEEGRSNIGNYQLYFSFFWITKKIMLVFSHLFYTLLHLGK